MNAVVVFSSVDRFSVLSFTLSYMIRSVTQSFSTEKELKEV